MKIELQRVAPAEIEARSMEIIQLELGERTFPAEVLPVVKRVIHTTADFDYARNLVFTPGAVEAGVRALRAGTPILTDTNMARSGINRGALERLGIESQCIVTAQGYDYEAGYQAALAILQRDPEITACLA
mgnify:CR=1 FL=1